LIKISIQKLLDHYKKTADDLFAAIGRGDITTGQLANTLHNVYLDKNESIPLAAKLPKTLKQNLSSDEISFRGVANLLTTISNCCRPVPGDDIIGFITRGKGVAVHRKDCINIINLEDDKRNHLIDADWGGVQDKTYNIFIHIEAYDRQGLLSDVSQVLTDEKVDVIGVNTLSNKEDQTADMTITAEIIDLDQLGRVMDKIKQLQNVISVKRQYN